jgi:hypothetical protein
MVVKLLKYAVFTAIVLVLVCGNVSAQSPLKSVHTAPSLVKENTPAPPPVLKKIFSNLGPTPTDNYNDAGGYYVLGSANTVALSEQWIALPFTTTAASHAQKIEAAIGVLTVGTPGAYTLGLYSDSGSNSVGTLLASGNATATTNYNTCCTLSAVSFTGAGIALTAHTQYWIVAEANDTSNAALTAVWDASNDYNIGGNEAQGGWFTFSANDPAAEVLGSIP